jgi:hypothetical protein
MLQGGEGKDIEKGSRGSTIEGGLTVEKKQGE